MRTRAADRSGPSRRVRLQRDGATRRHGHRYAGYSGRVAPATIQGCPAKQSDAGEGCTTGAPRGGHSHQDRSEDDGAAAKRRVHANMNEHDVCRASGVTRYEVQCMHKLGRGKEGMSRRDRMQRWREMRRRLSGCISDERSGGGHGCTTMVPHNLWHVEERHGEAVDESRVRCSVMHECCDSDHQRHARAVIGGAIARGLGWFCWGQRAQDEQRQDQGCISGCNPRDLSVDTQRQECRRLRGIERHDGTQGKHRLHHCMCGCRDIVHVGCMCVYVHEHRAGCKHIVVAGDYPYIFGDAGPRWQIRFDAPREHYDVVADEEERLAPSVRASAVSSLGNHTNGSGNTSPI